MASTVKAEGKLKLEVACPRGLIVDEMVDEVIAPAFEGQMGALLGHEPYLALLKPGTLSFREEGGELHHVAISSGFLEAGADRVRVLARTAERPDQIDLGRARKALTCRQTELLALPSGDPTCYDLELAIARARARLLAVELEQKRS